MSFMNYVRRAGAKVLLGLCLLCLPLLASCGPTNSVELSSIDLGIPAAALNSPVTGPLPDTTQLHLGITLKISQNVLNHLGTATPAPGQPSHLEKIANSLGIDDSTYQKFKDFFNLTGLKLSLSKLRTHISVEGKASLFAKVFSTHFVRHTYNGRAFFAPATPPKLPRFLANTIVAVTGLDNYSVPPQHTRIPLSHATTRATKQAAQDCSPRGSTLVPRQIAHAYGFDQLWNRGWHGEGMTVNLVEIDGFYTNDVQNYLNCINFQGKIEVSDVDNAPTEAAGESTLDLEMIAGLARSVHVVDYETGATNYGDVWTQVNDELQQILNDNTNNANNGSLVSISLGMDEADMTSGDVSAIDQSLRELTQAEHMRIFVASGDCGAFADRIYHDLSVSFPASDPWSTAVGGTVLQLGGGQQRGNEVAWSDGSDTSRCQNQWGTGGGVSQIYSRLDWQPGASRRQIPDIAAVAYNLAVYFQGQWTSVGGTSAAAPIWAAGMALVNEGLVQQLRKFTADPQMFYAVANNAGGQRPYFDVTQGNNLYYRAGPGWDACTGLGTPNLASFYQVLYNLLR
jgi:kumamolisin